MSGIGALHGDTYLGHELVIRQGRGVIPGPAYLQQAAERVDAWFQNWPAAVLAIEGVRLRARRPRRRPTPNDDGHLLALGKIVAALELYFPDAILVMPDRHGRNLLAAYPAPLVAPDELERLTGDGPLQHCRSAWDVAGRAQTLLRLAASRHTAQPSANGASVLTATEAEADFDGRMVEL